MQQQTDYYALHMAEVRGSVIDTNRREEIGDGALGISNMIHRTAIGEANAPGGWYAQLREDVQKNISALDARLGSDWWATPLSS